MTDAFGVIDSMGSGGSGLAPDGASCKPGDDLRSKLRTILAAIFPPYADSTALTASLAKNRADGQGAFKLDDYSLWVWKNADATAADATHIAPTDVGVGAGRWVKLAFAASGTAAGEVQKFATTFNIAAIQGKTSTTAFNVGAVLPANARVVATEVLVTTPITGGTLSACTCKVGAGTEAADAMMAAQDVFTAAGTFSDPGTNQVASRGGAQVKATLTATGDTLANATAGNITINVFYAVVA